MRIINHHHGRHDGSNTHDAEDSSRNYLYGASLAYCVGSHSNEQRFWAVARQEDVTHTNIDITGDASSN